jgi:hypothetical protein
VRALLALASLSGCTSLLGITDPTPAGDAGPDTMIDSSIDAPPPCAPSVMLGPEITVDLGKPGFAFAVSDFRTGGFDDLAIAAGDNVLLLFGDGAGSFGSPKAVATAANDLVVGDFNSDGFDDLVMWTDGGGSVVVRLQDRVLDPPVRPEAALDGPLSNVETVINTFLDGALRPDLLVQDETGSRPYLSNAIGTFMRTTTLLGTGADKLVLAEELDKQGREDALFVNAGSLKLALQGNNGFAGLTTIGDGVTGLGVAVGQFDGDTLLDIVVSTSVGLVLYRQGMGGAFAMHGVISPLRSTTPMHVLDLNDDGLHDLVLPNAVILQCAPPSAGAPGVFTQVESISAAPPSRFDDITANGKPDLIRIDGTQLKVRVR